MQIAQGQQTAQAAQDAHAAAVQEGQIKAAALQQVQTEQANTAKFRQRFAENAANPTAGGNIALMREFPQYVAQITGASKAISAEQAKQLQNIHAADLSGAHGVADSEIQKLATSYLNSKDPQDKAYGQSLMDGRKLHSENPGAYANIMGIKIAEGIGGEEYGKVYGGVTKLSDEILKGKADAAKALIDSNNEERKLQDDHNKAVAETAASGATLENQKYELKTKKALEEFTTRKTIADTVKAEADAQKMKREAQGLPEEGKKQYGEAYKDFTTANQAITKATVLANKIRKDGVYAGAPAVVNKYWHQFTGTPDQTARLNQEFSTLTSSSVLGDMSALGRITPAEIELFSKGVPDELQSGEDKAAWLDTYAKVMQFKRDQAKEKTDYINANGDLTPAKKNITINGKRYPMGSPPPGLDVAPAQPAGAPAPGTPAPAAPMTSQARKARLAQIDALLAANPGVK